jgi:hypothetical protein
VFDGGDSKVIPPLACAGKDHPVVGQSRDAH